MQAGKVRAKPRYTLWNFFHNVYRGFCGHGVFVLLFQGVRFRINALLAGVIRYFVVSMAYMSKIGTVF